MNGREVTRVGSSSVNCNRECAERNECQVFGELNPSENSGMTDTVSHKTGDSDETDKTAQNSSYITDSEPVSNIRRMNESTLQLIQGQVVAEDERINPTEVQPQCSDKSIFIKCIY